MARFTNRIRNGLVLVAVAAGTVPFGTASAQICTGGDVLECYPVVGAVRLDFARTFRGSYRQGEPYDVVTITPSGSGETLESVGITLRVQLVCNCPGVGPLAGIPAAEMVLFSSSLRFCSGLTAARDTDAEGWTEFSGTMRAGGCATQVHLFVDGIWVSTIPIRFNSPDVASPLGIDGSDLAALAARLGRPVAYDICFDFNEDGLVDASDVAFFAASLGASCE